MMLVLAALNMVPAPPGASAILGPPIVFFAAQIAVGLRRPWLPAWLLERDITFLRGVEPRINKRLKRAESVSTPRLLVLTSPAFSKIIGVVCAALGVVLALPIPLGNFLPGLSISLFALGLIGRDGVFVLGGFAVALAALAVIAGSIFAIAAGFGYVLH